MGRKPKPVRQYNGRTGIFIRRYPSISSAARLTNTLPGNIKNACEVEIRCSRYYWRYAENKRQLKVKVNKYRRGGKKVRVFNTFKGRKPVQLALCDSIKEASVLTGISHTTIRKICRAGNREILGYTFKFVNEEDKWNAKSEFHLYDSKRKNSRTYYKVPVKLTRDNKIYKFDSIAEASRVLNINNKSIINVLAGRWHTAGGYSVEKL